MNRLAKTLLICAVLPFATPGHAQLSLEGFDPTAGGGASSGGSFTLVGQVGQTAPTVATGGGYRLEAPSWGFIAVPLPRLSIQLLNGQVYITWPSSAAEWKLEVAAGPHAASPAWVPVSPPYHTSGAVYELVEPISSQARFYRLRREP